MYMYLKIIIPQVTANESCWNMDGRQATDMHSPDFPVAVGLEC